MENHLKSATILAKLLDEEFNVLGFRFGLDPIIGLIPGLGDALGLLLSLYIVWIGVQLKLPSDKIVLMVVNITLDFLIGAIPILGDIGDFVFKSNKYNLAIIRAHRPIKLTPA